MRKVLQNSLFAAMTAWALYGLIGSVPDHQVGDPSAMAEHHQLRQH